MATVRRLTAILAADVAGYSRLIGADESGTLQSRKAVRAELVDPKITEHRGRIVKTTGDLLLVEFASVVDALSCASEVQVRMAERNGALPLSVASNFGSAFTKAILLWRTETYLATASMSPLASKAWPNPAAFVYRRAFRKTLRASSTPPSKIWASRH
jgi:hypothetical protein